MGAVLLNRGPGVQAAARQLRATYEQRVRGLHLYAAPGPVDESARGLSTPFLRACREYLDAESVQPATHGAASSLACPPGDVTRLICRFTSRHLAAHPVLSGHAGR